MTNSPTRAAVYLRISRDRTGEGLGVERQQEDCIELAERLGWEVSELYVDNDTSAMSSKPRPEYQRMLRDLEEGKAQAIIAWHPDRLYRKVTDLGTLVEACKRNNIQVSTVRSGHVDLTTASGRLVAGLLAQVAMYEGEHKAERWVRAWRQGREQGRHVNSGTRMFGYTRDGEVIEEEAEIARRMARDILNNVPLLTLSRRLSVEGILTTRGSVWRPGTIKQYLTNPRLAGYSTLKREVVAEGKWQPILDRDTWETVRAFLTSRTRPYAPRVSLLNGLIFCGKCETRLITSGARGKRTYRCSDRPGINGCGGLSGYAEPIEEIVEAYARAKLADPKVRASVMRLHTQASPELIAEMNAIEERIRELEASLDNPEVPMQAILRAIDRSKERLGELQSHVTITRPTQLPDPDTWPEDLERRRRLVELVVAKVRLNPAEGRPRTFDPRRVGIDPT